MKHCHYPSKISNICQEATIIQFTFYFLSSLYPVYLFRPLISADCVAMVVDSSPRGPGPNERLLSSPCLSARVSAFQISVII